MSDEKQTFPGPNSGKKVIQSIFLLIVEESYLNLEFQQQDFLQATGNIVVYN